MEMEFGEQRRPDLILTVQDFGRGLASSEWTEDEATLRLSNMLMALGANIGESTAEDITTLTENATADTLRPDSPLIPVFIKIATRGMVFREDPDEEPLLDREPTLPEGFTVEDAISNSTEGIYWTDPKEERYRERMTSQTARMLRVFIDGMEESGYQRKAVKDVMRNEIGAYLDKLSSSTSYTAMYLTPVLLTIMTKARLHNVQTTVHWAKLLKTMCLSYRM